MNEYLDQVGAAVESGSATADHTVLLFRGIEDAEMQSDLEALERALELARRLSHQADHNLRGEGEHSFLSAQSVWTPSASCASWRVSA